MAPMSKENPKEPSPSSYLPRGNIHAFSTPRPSCLPLPGTVEMAKMKFAYILPQSVYNPPEVKGRSRDITI